MTDFAELHRSGTFLLVNAANAAEAAVAEYAGAVAIGTTSSGHAYTLGRPDGAGEVSRDEAVERTAQICAVVDIPVSVDAENGWGHEPDDVAETIRLLAEAGASGASIEDWSGDADLGFYGRAKAVARVEAAVETAAALDTGFVINARAEALLYGQANPVEEALARLQSFSAVGASCVYAPGIRDRPTVERFVAEAGAAVNVLLGVGSDWMTMADATEVGVRRVSVGGSLFRAALSRYEALVRQLVTTGEFATETSTITDATLVELFGR